MLCINCGYRSVDASNPRPRSDSMQESGANPLDPFLNDRGFMLLDGGLASSLEARGCTLDDTLWSARILLEDPESIRQVHLEFLAAGADCISTSSYQATLQAFAKRGIVEAEGIEILKRSVRLACEARDAFWDEPANRLRRRRPLVAASVGPYGAFLADGSEYTGDYSLGEEELYDFHRRRWGILAAAGADLLACETIPSFPETRALLRLCDETPDVLAWISFTCGDDAHLRDGTRLADAVGICDSRSNVVAVGVNCTSPERIAALIRIVRDNTEKEVFVYPNSGEVYDAGRKAWTIDTPRPDWVEMAPEWIRLGAAAVGGCCRTGSAEIARLRRLLEC